MPVFPVSTGPKIYIPTPAPQRDARKREQERFKEQHPVPEGEVPETYMDRATMSALARKNKKANYAWARQLDEGAKRERESEMARKDAGTALSKNGNSQTPLSLANAASSSGGMKPPSTPRGQIRDAALGLPKAPHISNNGEKPQAGTSAARPCAVRSDLGGQDAWTETDQERVLSVLLEHADMFCKVEGTPSQHEATFFRHALSAMPPDLNLRIRQWYKLQRLVSSWLKDRLDKVDGGRAHLEPPQRGVDKLIDRWVKQINRRFCYANRHKILSGLCHGMQPLFEEQTMSQIRQVLEEMHGEMVQEVRHNNVVSETFQNSQPSFVEQRCGEMARGNFARVVKPAVLQRVEGFVQMLRSWDVKLQDGAAQALVAAAAPTAPARGAAEGSPELGCADARAEGPADASQRQEDRHSEPESESGSEYQVSSDGSDSSSYEGSIDAFVSPVLPTVEEPNSTTPPCSPTLRPRLKALEQAYLRQLRARDDGRPAPESSLEARRPDVEDGSEAPGASRDFPIVVAPTPSRRVTPPRTTAPGRAAKRLIHAEASDEEATPTRRRRKRRDVGARADMPTPSLSSPSRSGEEIARTSTVEGSGRSNSDILRDLERRMARLEQQSLG